MTMKSFPDHHDLIALFECEPVLSDPDVIWAYNGLSFVTDRGSDKIVCEIEPGYEIVEFQWIKAGKEIISLNLNWVSGIEAQLSDDIEALILHFRDKHLKTLKIQFKPFISMSWSTDSEPL
jgi:hypothetical protein